MQEALDKLEQEVGYTLTGPVRELVSTQIVNVLSKSLGVVARNEAGQEEVVYLLPRNSEVPMEATTDFGTDQANQTGVEIKVMAGERDSPARRGLPGSGHGQPGAAGRPAREKPDPGDFRNRPRWPA